MKYFYTSELGYADFAVKHGFEWGEYLIEDYDNYPKWVAFTQSYGRWKEWHKWRFPRTPHNEALMVKQEFNVVKQIGKTIVFNKIGIIQADSRLKLFVQPDGFRDYVLDNWIITERNNKPFPVWDKEGA